MSKVLAIFIGVSFLTFSCQKRPIPLSGHFTQYKPLHLAQGRTIASIAEKDDLQIDPKQVYLSCYLKENRKQQECYEQQAKVHQIQDDFEKIKTEITEITKSIVSEVTPKILTMLKAQNKFCLKNSTISFENCLKLKREKDSIEISNQYQTTHPNLNGQEYLYLKGKISERYNEFLKDFLDEYKEMKGNEVSKVVSANFHYVASDLNKELGWIETEKFLPNCHLHCQKQAKRILKEHVDKESHSFLEMTHTIEEKCSEFLALDHIIEKINLSTNHALEQEITKISEEISSITAKKSIQCLLEKRIYNSESIAKKTLDECFNKSWSQESEEVLNAWLSEQAHDSFFAKNHIFIFNKVKAPKQKIRRGIASHLESSTKQ